MKWRKTKEDRETEVTKQRFKEDSRGNALGWTGNFGEERRDRHAFVAGDGKEGRNLWLAAGPTKVKAS